MGDDSSYEEDFSGEITMFSTQDIELPKKETKKEESAFEILSIENIVQDVFEMVYKVQSFLAVRVSFIIFSIRFFISFVLAFECKCKKGLSGFDYLNDIVYYDVYKFYVTLVHILSDTVRERKIRS